VGRTGSPGCVAPRYGLTADDQVLVSEVALSRIDLDASTVGRSRRLKAQGAPRGLRVVEVSR
jgi:hypothetical protein